jgi:anaerobic selenocysteine-containing dehydrogenase/ferredoxin-NADP reductase
LATERIAGYCTLCRSRCGTINTVRDGRLISVEPAPDHPTGRAVCAKGRAAPEIVHSTRRLEKPLKRTRPKGDPDPGWRPVSWDEALDEIASRLGEVRAKHGAESVAFAVTSPSGTPMSDGIDWVERFIRKFGSPNICYATEICNWHKDVAHAFTFGCGIPTPDYANSDLILLWGHNPASAWLSQAGAVAEARSRGAKLIVVDPRRAGYAGQADHWLRVRPGTDGALALGLIHLLLTANAFDEAFVRSWTNAPFLVRIDNGLFLRETDLDPASPTNHCLAYDAHRQAAVPYDSSQDQTRQSQRFALRGEYRVKGQNGLLICRPAFDLLWDACATFTPQRVAEITWILETEIRAVADTLKQSKSVSYYAWSGIGQHTNATQTERAIATLYALTGCFDAKGGNQQLNRQPANRVSDLAQLPEAQRLKALGIKERPLGPPAQGLITARDLCGAIIDGSPYPIRALMVFGANLLVSQSEPLRTEAALRQLPFHVHCDLFETPTARFADFLLPVNSPWEREALRVGFEISADAEERVQLRRRIVPPVGESRSDAWIVFELAKRLGHRDEFFGGSIEAGYNHILEPLGLTVEQLRQHPEGVRVPLDQSYRKYSDRLARGEPAFATETQRVEIYSEKLLRHGYPALPAYEEPGDSPISGDSIFPYVLTSAKNGYYCHTQHRGLQSLRRKVPEPIAQISADLAREKSLVEGEWVSLRTRAGSARFKIKVNQDLHPRVIVADYGWWDACADIGLPSSDPTSPKGSNYNGLISSDKADPLSGSVPHRSFLCRIDTDTRRDAWSGFRPFRVTELHSEADDVVSVTLSPSSGGPLPNFRPGQNITVRIDNVAGAHSVIRSYSLSCAGQISDRRSYRITTKRVEAFAPSGEPIEGLASTHITKRLRVDETVYVQPPGGAFAMPLDCNFPVVLVAAGIGITPFVSYLESLLAAENPPEVTAYYGNRNGRNHAFKARIVELADKLPRLKVLNHYSRPLPEDRPGVDFQFFGRISGASFDQTWIDRGARFYLCGPELMLKDLQGALKARGVPAFHIFYEVFRSPPSADSFISSAKCQVTFARSKRDITWSPSQGTLLSFAEAHGLTLPSGCRAGQCESCAVPLLKGGVRYLMPLEADEPGVCLTCQAIPTSDLVLDA